MADKVLIEPVNSYSSFGKNRVIRRTMEYFDKHLLHLDRIEFAGIQKRFGKK